MEILEHGNTYKVYTCEYCECVFAAWRKDVHWSNHLDDVCVKCPECGIKIKVEGTDW